MTREQAIRKGSKRQALKGKPLIDRKTGSITPHAVDLIQRLSKKSAKPKPHPSVSEQWALNKLTLYNPHLGGLVALHAAGLGALRILEDMERAGAMRLPFPGYQEAVVDLRRALA